VADPNPDRDFGRLWPSDNVNSPPAKESPIDSRKLDHGVVFFYWEGLWGMHVPQGDRQRRYGFLNALGRFEQE